VRIYPHDHGDAMDKTDRKSPPGYNALRRGRWSESGRAYMVTTVTENRAPVFADLIAGRVVVSEMMRLENEGRVQSLAFVLMPNHLHWLLVLGENEDLSRVVGLFKGRSAREVNKALNRKGHLWQRAFYDHAIRKDEDLQKLARYIVGNPIRAGIVKRVGDYPLWDAVWLDPLCA
jgi:putative transposase